MTGIQFRSAGAASAALLCVAFAPGAFAEADLDASTARSLAPIRVAQANACNPCSKNACNPCGGKALDPSRFKQPTGRPLQRGNEAELVAKGEKLWNDRKLGNSGIACATCHTGGYGQMNDSFGSPYPHRVAMPASQAGVSEVNAAEMVNFCMLVPMQAEPLAWNSTELAALTAYVEKLQDGFEPRMGKANACNPCGGSGNPCNPCGGGSRNPCNPCGR